MVLVDICIAAGIPTVIMVLRTLVFNLVNISSNPRVPHVDYIVQGHRFDILEDVGCYPVVYNTLPAYFIYFMWPIVLGAISFCFSGSSIVSLFQLRHPH